MKNTTDVNENKIIKYTIQKLFRKLNKQLYKPKHKRNYKKITTLIAMINILENKFNEATINDLNKAVADETKFINLNEAEIQSKFTRVFFAERLIIQLPKEHEGRNSWLLNYGVGEEARKIRQDKNLIFDEFTQSCELVEMYKK